MNLTKLALKRPVTTSMFFVAILLFGMAATRLLPLEMYPGIDVPEININVPYNGSTPAEVEREITQVLEESLATMTGIDEMRSDSDQNGANIRLKMKWDENVATKGLEAREKIDAVSHLLPDDVERIFVQQFSTADMSILTIRISSQRELSGAFDLLDKQLKRPLERIDGISRVALYGVEKKQIEVRLNAEKLLATGMSMAELNRKMASQNFVVNAGSLRANNSVYQVSPKGEFRSLDDIRNVWLRPDLRLSDVATIGFALPEATEGRHLDKKYAVGLDVFKESGANLVQVSERVINLIEKTKKDSQFDGIKLYIMEDQAAGVKSSLKDLLLSGLLGAFLSFGILYFFLRDLKMTLVIVSSVPISMGMTLAAMYFLGYSLNILSMMGLLLAIGMLIDNAVVVTESVLQEQEKSKDKNAEEVILSGIHKVTLAVLAGTLTTAIVFLPNIFGVKVELTIFLEHVAIAICISLLASLLVSKTLIPLFLKKLNFKPRQKPKSNKLQVWYQRSLNWSLSRPKLSGFIAVMILVSTAIPLGVVQNNGGGEGDDRLFINYMIEGRHTVEVIESLVTEMEDYLYANKDKFHIDSVYSYYNPERGQSTLILKKDTKADIKELKETIRAGFPKFSIAKPQFGWGRDNNGVRITLTGRSTSELIRISEQVLPLISNIEGLVDVRSEINAGQKEIVIKIDPVMASRLGVELRQIARNISIALRGVPLRSYRHNPNGELRIELAYEKGWRQSLDKLKQLPVLRIGERVYSLDNLATIHEQPRLDNIRHYNRQTALTIGASLDELSTDEARDKITRALDAVTFPHGYKYSLRGAFERQDEDEALMVTNMLLAIIMIYIVMAALFESLLLPTAIITSILYSITGVFWAMMFTGNSMSVMAMIGILILIGIVVNNGIVLVDQINQMQPKLNALTKTIHEVCITRLRPVLMTVSTTILGLLPLALGETKIGGGGPPYSPMAIAIIGGLAFSTMTSLYLVPLCYQALYRMRYKAGIQLSKSNHKAKSILSWLPEK
ncbi:efflux RND transporter permease subunit [Parashewanella spongiae]|uniref:Efflux RND transporter permease subunit n=1 Tax=Parashewanella spongiae TaxID=342950 RepID=A0A3A6TV98_9GAMM|nr:efflux RND transporter permease subunit [Parashewanella spongiae]MCL1077583.1 efflux RND transporter permease subunit [Parashewanella spongiae]RJY18207.1 efflux RND transporter permease subunit [Parashewanella spongiae]